MGVCSLSQSVWNVLLNMNLSGAASLPAAGGPLAETGPLAGTQQCTPELHLCPLPSSSSGHHGKAWPLSTVILLSFYV